MPREGKRKGELYGGWSLWALWFSKGGFCVLISVNCQQPTIVQEEDLNEELSRLS